MSSILIAKREGAIEAFDRGKLRRVIALAMEPEGHAPQLASALASAVEMHLAAWDEPRPPTSDYIFKCVCEVLQQTGMDDVGVRMRRLRRLRHAQRKNIRIVERSNESANSVMWRKALVAELFERLYALGSKTARALAAEVEQRILRIGYREVSTTLLHEIMRTEVRAWGLLDEAYRTQPTGQGDAACEAPASNKP